jgi:NAD-dependent deacetylase
MNIFVLTGAGVSAESGLGTFRDKAGSGIWAKFDPMKLATPGAFAAHPEEVHAFYNMRRHNLLQAEPNPAHFALARLEATLSERGGHLFLCTQNIDDLHERAGSRRAVHMHGELLKARCIWCEAVTQWRGDLAARMPARPVAGRAACARTWFGSVRCPSAWT